MNGRTYTVDLWDDDIDSGVRVFARVRGGWSGALAREHLAGPNEGLTWRGVGLAIRKLYAAGWSNASMHVERTDPDAP